MTTIRMADPVTVTGKTKEIFDAVLRREAEGVWRDQRVEHLALHGALARDCSRRTGSGRAR